MTTVYRYAYLGKRRSDAKLHIWHVGHGILCRPEATDYWTPRNTLDVEVAPSDGWWITLVAAHTLCARCRKAFETEHGR